MKRPRRADGNKDIAAPVPGSQAEFSYGLVMRLENFELDQLSVKQLPKVGQEVTISAKAKVIRVAESASSANKGDRNVELQVTHLDISGVAGKVEKREADDKGGRGRANVGQVERSDHKANVGRAGKTDGASAQ